MEPSHDKVIKVASVMSAQHKGFLSHKELAGKVVHYLLNLAVKIYQENKQEEKCGVWRHKRPSAGVWPKSRSHY